jgi:hypothetical protein
VDDQGPRAQARAEQARDLCPLEQERARRPAIGPGLRADCQERPVGHADAREIEHRTEVDGEAGTTGVVASGGVRDDDLGLPGQRPNCRLQQSALAQRQQSRPVEGPSRAPHDRGPAEVAVGAHERRSGPAALARSEGAPREADKATGDERPRTRRTPGRRAPTRELALEADELRLRLGPHPRGKYPRGDW